MGKQGKIRLEKMIKLHEKDISSTMDIGVPGWWGHQHLII